VDVSSGCVSALNSNARCDPTMNADVTSIPSLDHDLSFLHPIILTTTLYAAGATITAFSSFSKTSKCKSSFSAFPPSASSW